MWTNQGGGRVSTMEYGRGQYLYDDRGAQYLDCINSTAQVGHCDAGVLAAACQHLGELLPDVAPQVSDSEFERLLSNTLPAHLDTFFHCDSGTQAVDLAIRLARLWCGKKVSQDNKSPNGGSQLWDVTHGGGPEETKGSSTSKERRKSDPGTSIELGEFGKSYACPQYGDSVGDDIEPSLPRFSSCSSSASGASSAGDASFSATENRRSSKSSENRIYTAKRSSSPPDSPESSSSPQAQRQSKSGDRVPAFFMKSCAGKPEKKRRCDSTSESGFRRLAYGDVVVVEGSFHGCTDSVVKLSSRMPSRSPRSPKSSLYSVHVVPLLDLYRARCGSAAALQSSYDLVESVVQRHLAECRLVLQRATDGGRKLACLLVEPHLTIQGGQHPPAAWLQGLFSLVREYGGLCVSDEVQSGLGRLGDTVWGFESQGVTPDIVIIAKGIGNGLPMAVTVTTAAIAASLGPLRSAYKCNTLQNAVGAAVLHSLHQGGLMHSAATTGRYLQLLLIKLQEKHPYVGDVRGRGLLQVVDIVWSREQRVPSAQIADFLVHKLRRVGVVIAKEGVHKNVLVVMPPMTFDLLDAASLATKLDEALSIVPYTFGLDQPVHVRNRRPLLQPENDPFLFLDVTRPSMMGATFADVTFESYHPRDSLESPMRGPASHPVTQCHHQVNHSCSCHRHSKLRVSTSEEISPRSQPSSSLISESPNGGLLRGSKKQPVSSFCRTAPISHTSMGSETRTVKRPFQDISTSHRSVQTTSSHDVSSDSPLSCPHSRDVSEVQLSIDDSSNVFHSRLAPRTYTTAHPSTPASLPEPPIQTSTKSFTEPHSSTRSHIDGKRTDLFSNIILVEKDISPDFSKIDSTIGTFVRRRSQRLTLPRQDLHGRGEASGASSTMEAEKKEDLHPNEMPRTCKPVGTGLGMVQPLPARPNASPSPHVSYEDVD